MSTGIEIGGERLEPFAFTVEEAAELSRLSRSTIYLALKDSSLVGRKVGRRTLILPEDLKRFMGQLPTFKCERDGGGF